MLKALNPIFSHMWGAENQTAPQAAKSAPDKKFDDLHDSVSEDASSTDSIAERLSPRSSQSSPRSGFELSQAFRRPAATRRAPAETASAPATRAITKPIGPLLTNAIAASIYEQPNAHELWAEAIDCLQRSHLDLGAILSKPFAGSGTATALEELLSGTDLRSLRLIYEHLPHGTYCNGHVVFDRHGLRTMKDGLSKGPGIMVLDEAFFLYEWKVNIAFGHAYSYSNLDYYEEIHRASYFPDERHIIWSHTTYLDECR